MSTRIKLLNGMWYLDGFLIHRSFQTRSVPNTGSLAVASLRLRSATVLGAVVVELES